MIEDIMENEKYEDMKRTAEDIEPDGNGKDNNRRKTQSCHQPGVYRTPKEDRGYRPLN